jgi:hypothetical protein
MVVLLKWVSLMNISIIHYLATPRCHVVLAIIVFTWCPQALAGGEECVTFEWLDTLFCLLWGVLENLLKLPGLCCVAAYGIKNSFSILKVCFWRTCNNMRLKQDTLIHAQCESILLMRSCNRMTLALLARAVACPSIFSLVVVAGAIWLH